MSKLPAFQFYPGDWMKDPALRSVSHAARGLWMDMLCLMFESPRRGFLQQANGRPLSQQQLARMTGCSCDEAVLLLEELVDAGVCSTSEDGVIFSRRMVRDQQLRKVRAAAGKLGGNPNLLIQKPKQTATTGIKQDKQNPTPSSSTSTSKQDHSTRDQQPAPNNAAPSNAAHGNAVPPVNGEDPTVGDLVAQIACAHPLAASRGLTPAQVPQNVCAAIVQVLAAGEAPMQLLAKVRAVRDVVLQTWPASQRKYLKRMDLFFQEYEFNRPIEEWSYAKHQGNRATKQSAGQHPSSKAPAAVERQRVTHDAIRAAGARRYGTVATDHDGAGAGLLSRPGAA